MGTKMHLGSKKRAALIGAAVLPAATALMAHQANAAPTLTITNLGTTRTAAFTTTGWTSFLISATADSGQVITAMDIGSPSNPTNGIFGQLLQRWGYNSGTYKFETSSPTDPETVNGNSATSADTHVVTLAGQATVNGSNPNEDSNVIQPGSSPNTNHPAGAPNDTAFVRFGTGTFLKGAVGYNSPQNNTQPIAYVVLKDGSTGTIKVGIAEAVPAGSSTGFVLTGTFGGGVTTVTNKIVSLTAVSAGAPTTYGSKLTNGTGVDKATFNPNAPVADSINVVGANGSYVKGQANNINSGTGENKFFVQASGFSPATDQEIYALNIKVGGTDPTGAQDSAIVADINANNQNVTASLVTGQFASLFPGYDILLTATAAGNSAPAILAIDFSADSTTPGVVVTDVAAVPEPASAAALLLGATGLLLGRRKRNA